jgi:molecular chaperone GrpE
MSKKVRKLHPVAELAAIREKIETEKTDGDKYIRLAAEFDNYKKRTAKQFSELIENANQSLILEILSVVDDFERALESSLPKNDDQNSENNVVLYNGMKLIYDKLIGTLRNKGVEVMDDLDKQFDPNIHDAVMQAPSEDKEAGTITAVVSPGYKMNNKVIRHAKVVVAAEKEKD